MSQHWDTRESHGEGSALKGKRCYVKDSQRDRWLHKGRDARSAPCCSQTEAIRSPGRQTKASTACSFTYRQKSQERRLACWRAHEKLRRSGVLDDSGRLTSRVRRRRKIPTGLLWRSRPKCQMEWSAAYCLPHHVETIHSPRLGECLADLPESHAVTRKRPVVCYTSDSSRNQCESGQSSQRIRDKIEDRQ